MAAVRKGAFDSPGTVFGPFELRAPTDATQWRPYLETATQRETGDRRIGRGFVSGGGWRPWVAGGRNRAHWTLSSIQSSAIDPVIDSTHNFPLTLGFCN